ncbi:hypothetical protein NXZ75_20120 [Lysinibacillus sphaericus]|uniref:hypothetical protein n=1 Tax=Lysinibacillus sphaericus TaxID=1421 RepID=UPI002163697B|nr:hypothetical protein [Lysinibacillus sphaericus]MCS1384506.1 hypothetical protein [Lysinibacillus sphaericus]
MDPSAQIVVVENNEDFNELVIKNDAYYDVSGYTSYPFIYEVTFIYSELRAKHLLAYLEKNIREEQIVELCRVWIGHDENELHIPYVNVNYEATK